jgi:type IV pilus assembly protein PilM
VRTPLIYKDQPILGLDIGSRTAKLVQLEKAGKKTKVVGYGFAAFPADAIIEGILSDPQEIAESIKTLLAKPLAGKLTARRVAISIPNSKVFTRILQLPPMDDGDLEQAVRFEAEQYVPVPLNDLYIDYEVIAKNSHTPIAPVPATPTPADGAAAKPAAPTPKEATEQHQDVLMVAAPRAIIDSYMKLFDFIDLEVDSVETSLAAITRAMITANRPEQATLVVDFGSHSTDFTVYEGTSRLTGTFSLGGDDLTQILVKNLGITADQANEIKYKFGLGTSGLQSKIMNALTPELKTMVAELKKAIKFYQDRSEGKKTIDTMFLTGGSSRMPGLVDYLYKELAIPIIIGDPWQGLVIKPLGEVSKLEGPMYTTAIGLAQRGLLK